MSDEKTKPKRRIKKRWIILATIVVLLVAARIALPIAVESIAVSTLEDMGVTVETPPSVNFALLQGRIQIENLVAKHESGEPLAIGHIHADLDWGRLFSGEIVLEEIEVGAVEISIVIDEENAISVSGIPIPASEPPAEPADPIMYEVVKLDVAGSRIGLRIQEYATLIAIDQVGLEYLGNIEPEKQALVDFVVSVDDAPVSFGGHATPFHSTPGTAHDIKIESLDIAPFAPWLRIAGLYEPAGTVSLELAIDANYDQETQSIETVAEGSINVNGFRLKHDAVESPSITASWNGKAEAKGPLNALRIALQGALNVDPVDVRITSNDAAISTQPIDWNGNVTVMPGSSDLLAIDGTLGIVAGAIKIYTDEASQDINFDALKLDLKPFTLASDNAFSGTGALSLGSGSFDDPNSAVSVISSALDIQYDLQATPGEQPILAGSSTINIGEASAEIGADEEKLIASITGLALDAQGIETSLSGENIVRATPTLSLDRATVENAGGFDASVDAIDYAGALDVGGEVVVAGDVSLGPVEFTNREQTSMNGTVGSLKVNELSVSSDSRVTASQVEIDDVSAFDTLPPLKENNPKSINIGSLRVATMDVGAEAFTADTVELSDINVILQRRKDGSFAFSPPPSEATEEAPAEAEVQPEAESDPNPEPEETNEDAYRVAVESLRVQGDNTVRFYDASLDPAASLRISPISATIDALDTADTSTPTRFDFTAGMGERGEITAKGAMSLDPVAPTGNATATITAVDLIPFDTYTQRFIGYRLATGKVDYNADISIDKGEIDAKTDITLQSLAMERLTTEEKSELTEQLGVPVNTALSLLRDPDDAIRLKIPITGNLANPSFGIGDAIRKATVNAMKSSVTAVFAPVGLVLGAANKTTFDPVLFERGSTELTPEGIELLAKVAELMKKKPKVKLRVCGVATRVERKAAGVIPPLISVNDPDAETLLDPNLSTEPKTAEEESMPGDEGLRELATERGRLAVNYLVDEQGINHERLFECAPRIDTAEDAKPRVSIGL